jgi:hypothetical protein
MATHASIGKADMDTIGLIFGPVPSTRIRQSQACAGFDVFSQEPQSTVPVSIGSEVPRGRQC